MRQVPEKVWREAVRRALEEDVGPGDVTSLAVVPPALQARAWMKARQPLVVCGLEAARLAFQSQHRGMRIQCHARDGQAVKRGAVLMEITGPARALLTAERVALNFVQRLSGIATLTAAFVKAVRGTGAQILDTRKTTPGLRLFEKYAVACGGGSNHRLGLHDMVLIKDNHLAALAQEGPRPIVRAVQRARARYPHLKVEVEADTLPQVEEAVEAGVDFILLDNMTPRQLRAAVRRVAGRARTEASGGVTLRTVRAIARTGVDFISVGALTHSAPAVDVALDFAPAPGFNQPASRRRAPVSRPEHEPQ
ncbi:carboxylating nicotinate-nucleotide diphosphorylase [Fontisphaera persica]|uniref:carboxylating nicotinate-nucleotide diphosphorylase n=1 Tax=Fontisphaera persica TaxID=2974023 RepID=UPI0024C0A607|nr:carboxylating nicotinate-nucleotide diphosphorylase [Fontisphaera persica]WCJ58976.1 carboxylating nicotinate-nucleotide diphosphorylase [Fontisphaera persica]